MYCLISMLAVCTALVRVYEVYEILAVKLLGRTGTSHQ